MRRPVLRADLARAEAAGPDTLARLPLLYALSENSLTTREETSAWARSALALPDMAGAPPLARLAVEAWAVGSQDVERESSKRYFERLGQMRAQAPYAADPKARSAIASMIADSSKHDDLRRAMLSSIGDESGLPTAHPLKAGALMRLASLERAAGDVRAAQAGFENRASVPTSARCSTSSRGSFRRAGPSRWRPCAGGSRAGHAFSSTLDSAGRTVKSRAVVSYPPFVPTKAGTAAMATARYEKSFRPDGGLGCGGKVRSVRFLMPG